jgi:two-component system chemotaxis response regulator CheY
MTANISPLGKAKARILVIDDGITMRMYYRDVLEGAGFEVEEAVNGLEGVERAMTGTFDLLVVDVNMPKMDGYEVTRTIRNDVNLCLLPVLTISTEDKEADAAKAYEAGANFYMSKPVRPQDLTEIAHLLTGTAAS